jgi:FtsZ-interacting cell division protein ZipA
MSAGAIVAIVIAACIVLALLFVVLPAARRRKQERLVERRRREVAGAHRDEAESRMARAQLAEKEAARERAEAELHQQRAALHERGMADGDLDHEHSRVQDGRFVRDEREPVAEPRDPEQRARTEQ